MRRRPRRPSPRLPWSSAVHVLTEVDPELIARLRERGPLLLDRPRRARPTEEVDRLGAALDLHPVALEDTLEFGQRPKIDPYEDHVLLVFYTRARTPARAARGPHLHLGRVHRDRAPRRRARARRLCTTRSPSEPTHDEEMLVYRVLDGLTDAFYPVIDALEDRDRRARGRGPRAPAARAAHAAATGSSRTSASCTGSRSPSSSSSRPRHEAILGLEGLTKGSRPYLRDIGDHLVQIAGEFQRQLDDLLGAHADLLQRELRPAQRGRHAADDRRHDLRHLHGRDRLLRPELRLAGRQHRHQARLPALRRRRARGARP